MKELELRGKIASDLHDDVGSTLSSIRMYSDIVKHQPNQTSAASELLDKISSNSKEMIENMSDIVWMIKPGNDDFKSIENRMLNFANELCIPANINFEFNKEASTDAVQMSMEQRRDIYLIFKEALNNLVKYSNASRVSISLVEESNFITLTIHDNGIGFDTNSASTGNGLLSMKTRAEEMNALLKIESEVGNGTHIQLKLKA